MPTSTPKRSRNSQVSDIPDRNEPVRAAPRASGPVASVRGENARYSTPTSSPADSHPMTKATATLTRLNRPVNPRAPGSTATAPSSAITTGGSAATNTSASSRPRSPLARRSRPVIRSMTRTSPSP